MNTTLTSLQVRQIDALKLLGNYDKEVCFGTEYNKYKAKQHFKSSQQIIEQISS